MPIKWKALPVMEAMDKVEVQVNLANDFIKEARKIITEARSGADVPQYVTQPLDYLDWDMKNFLERVQTRIKRVRDSLPADALKDERALRKLGEVQTMF